MNFRIRQGVNDCFLVFIVAVLIAGCVQSNITSPTKPINVLPPNTVAGIVAKADADARAERSALARSIAEQVRSGELKTPGEQGDSWNKNEPLITEKANAIIATTIKAAFLSKAEPEAVWLELARGYQ